MDLSDNAVCAALASRERPRGAQVRPLSDPALATLVRDNVFNCDVAARGAEVAAPPSPDALGPPHLAVA